MSKPGTARWPRPRRSSAPAPSAASRSSMVNLGGGFPAKYVRKTPKLESYGKAIFRALRRHFGNAHSRNHRRARPRPRRQCRHDRGRGGADRQAQPEDEMRWVYLDIGKFHGLAETIDESIRYPIRTRKDRDEMAPCIIAGPDLRFRRRAVREEPLPAAGLARHRRQGADRGDRRLYDDLFVGRLQRLSAAAAIRDLTADRSRQMPATLRFSQAGDRDLIGYFDTVASAKSPQFDTISGQQPAVQRHKTASRIGMRYCRPVTIAVLAAMFAAVSPLSGATGAASRAPRVCGNRSTRNLARPKAGSASPRRTASIGASSSRFPKPGEDPDRVALRQMRRRGAQCAGARLALIKGMQRNGAQI